MLSRTSFFNKTLFCKNLSRFWPLWGGASLIGAMIPLVLVLSLMGSYHYKLNALDIQEALYGVLCYAVPVITLFYAVLVAMAVWNYLFNTRSVGLMHTLPVDRTNLFCTTLFSGMAMLLIPYAVTGGLVILICLFNGALPIMAVLETIAGVVGHSIFYFATATLCAMVTGHLAALPCFYFIGHFFFYLAYLLVSNFAGNFIFGFNSSNNLPDWYAFLTPTVYFYDVVDYRTIFDKPDHDTRIIELEGLWLIGVYALIGVGILALSWLLYRRRHSESAGDVVAVNWLRPIFRYGVALCTAITLGQVLYEVLWRTTFSGGSYYQIVPMGIFMFLSGLIGYYIASMLLVKSLRVFRKSLAGAATVAALVVILCACVSLDVFGVASSLPDSDEVEQLNFRVSGENLTAVPGDEFYDDLVAFHRMIIADEHYIRANDEDLYGNRPIDYENTNYVYINFDYILKDNEGMVARRYRVPLTLERWEGGIGTYDYRLNHLLNDPASVARRLNRRDGQIANLWVYFYTEDTHNGDPLTGTVMENIWAAMEQDAREGNFMQVNFINKSYPATDMGHIEAEFRVLNTAGNGFYYDYQNYYLTPSMTHTLSALLDNGVITAEQYLKLLTYVDAEYSAKFPDELTSFPKESYGIIGGADGPTEITVATIAGVN